MNETSLSLLERASQDPAGDSWVRLADVYSPLLRAWLARLGVQAADADDLVQEVLMTVARELREFRHSGRTGAFRSWLRTILTHRVRDFWRSARYRPPATGGTPFDTKPGETYRISFWAKNAGSEFVFKARGVSPLAGDKGAIIRSKETFNEWRQFECTYTIPPGPKMHLRVELNVVQPGTFWIDDLQVVKVDDEAAAAPAVEPGGAAASVPDEHRLRGKWVAVSGHMRKQPLSAEQRPTTSMRRTAGTTG